MTTPAIVMSIASVLLMLYSGLLFDAALIRQLATRHHLGLLGRLLLVNFVAIPLATLAIVSLFSSPSDLKLVLLTLAVMPCAPMVPTVVSMAAEPPQWSLFIFLCFSLLSILLLPILLVILPQSWAAGPTATMGLRASAGLTLYIATVYVPLFVGIAIRVHDSARGLAMLKRLRPWMSIAIWAALLLFIYVHWTEIAALELSEFGVLLLFETICLAAVPAFGIREWRAAPMSNILPSAFRNFALGLAFVSAVFPHTMALSYMIAFTMMSVPLIACIVIARRLFIFKMAR